MFFSVKVFDMPLLSSAQHRIMKNCQEYGVNGGGAIALYICKCFIQFF